MVHINEGLTLADFGNIIKKRKITALLLFISTIVSVYFFTRNITPEYRSSASVELKAQTSHLTSLGGFPAMMNIINRDTEMRKIGSYPIISQAAVQLGLISEDSTEADKDSIVSNLQGKISVKEVENTTLIMIFASDSLPEKAIEIANTVADVYIRHTISERNDRARKTREFIEGQLTSVGKELRDVEEKARRYKLTGKITDNISDIGSTLNSLTLQRSRLLIKYGEKHPDVVGLDKQISNLKYKMGSLTGEELEYLYLMREVTINEELYMMLNKKLKEALIAEADKLIPVAVVDPARRASLVKPNKKLNMIVGIIGGLLLSLIGVLIRENLDTSLNTAHDIEDFLSVPALTEIPFIKVIQSDERLPLLLFQNKNSAFLEAFNNLAASIISFSHKRDIKTILFTSMMPREGKSEIVANLGIIKSQSGSRTLLIDADFRQPTLSKLFRVSRKPGVIDIITDKLDWKHWIHPANSNDKIKEILLNNNLFNLENLSILTAGHLPPHPMRFLNSDEFRNLILSAREEFDTVLLDSPPLYYFSDPAIMSDLVDAIIMVHKPGSVDRNDLLRATKQLGGTESKLLGITLNEVSGKVRGKYYYRYYSK
ncbi:MAG: polysaccharide biosynthesis tyrosine autokinase [Elusimicrobiota bacterium]